MTTLLEGRVLLCVATEKGLEVLRCAIQTLGGDRITVCTFKEVGVVHSFHEEIQRMALSEGASVLKWPELRTNWHPIIRQLEIKRIICAGWRYLLPNDVLKVLQGEVVVAHDSLLPKLRGFAPLATALITGEDETGVTFLRAGSGVDNGPIIWQGRIPIGDGDTMSDLVRKLLPLYAQGTLMSLARDLPPGIPQDESQATYSIWRDDEDYFIDWSLDAHTIARAIRALGPPYLGARTRMDDKVITIHAAEVVDDLPFAIRQPGKVWSVTSEGQPVVICGSGLLKITQASHEGHSALPFPRLRVRLR